MVRKYQFVQLRWQMWFNILYGIHSKTPSKPKIYVQDNKPNKGFFIKKSTIVMVDHASSCLVILNWKEINKMQKITPWVLKIYCWT